jgi:hypothetical protein
MSHLNTYVESILKPTFTPKGKIHNLYKLHVVMKSIIFFKGFPLFVFSTSNLFSNLFAPTFIKVDNVKSRIYVYLHLRGSCPHVVPITIMHLAKVENNLISKAMFIVQKCKAKGV